MKILLLPSGNERRHSSNPDLRARYAWLSNLHLLVVLLFTLPALRSQSRLTRFCEDSDRKFAVSSLVSTFFCKHFQQFLLFSFAGSPNKPHIDAHFKDNSIARESRKLSFSTATCKGRIHRGVVQEILYREARWCSEKVPRCHFHKRVSRGGVVWRSWANSTKRWVSRWQLDVHLDIILIQLPFAICLLACN